MNPGVGYQPERRLFAFPNKAFHQYSPKGDSAAEYVNYGTTSQEAVATVREALTALFLAVLVSGILGVLIYLGADALMEFVFV